ARAQEVSNDSSSHLPTGPAVAIRGDFDGGRSRGPFHTAWWRRVSRPRSSAEPRLREHVPAVDAAQAGRGEAPCLVARGAGAAREVEVALEVAPLPDDLRAPQDEVVRVEEPAKIDVCEHPRRRRVARVLEPVQLDRSKRVAWGQLVDDEQRA